MNTYYVSIIKKDHFDMQFEANNVEEAQQKVRDTYWQHIEKEEPYSTECDVTLECENETEIWIKL